MISDKITPTKKQLEFLDWEFGVFFHFGIRTFYEGHRDWDYQEMPLKGFNPTELDCRNWIGTAKSAGAEYAILVTKHHDGFANWPSSYTDYSIKNTPYQNGNGDLVREFTEACAEFGMKVGLYYSPAEFSLHNNEKSGKDYDNYFINQVSELLCNYGKIDYLWFDGCGSEDYEYDQKRIVMEIRKCQPEIMLFNMWDPDTRWVGNEAGIAPSPSYNTVSALSFSVLQSEKDLLTNQLFLPAECDCRMRRDNWFYSDSDEETVKTLDELMGIYYYTVGRGTNLLLNLSPDRRGLLPEKDSQTLLAFGNEIKRRFLNPLSVVGVVTMADETVITLKECELVNHVVISEELSSGESILKFQILVDPKPYGDMCVVYEGNHIGHKAICQFPSIYTDKITIRILQRNGNYKIKSANTYYFA